jgi:hypothetical protein
MALDTRIPLGYQAADWGNSLASGVKVANSLRKSWDDDDGVYGTPVYMQGPNGLVLGTLTKDGDFRPAGNIGAGTENALTPAPPVSFQDRGNVITPMNTRTGQAAGPDLSVTGKPPVAYLPGEDGPLSPGSYMPNTKEAADAEKATQEAGAPTKGRMMVSTAIRDLSEAYDDLEKEGAAVDPSRGVLGNAFARTRASDAGQYIEGYLGTKAQTVRDRIDTLRPGLVSAIRGASNMSARALDSNVELQFYLKQATDPTLGLPANRAALKALEEQFGVGSPNPGVPEPRVRRVPTVNVSPDGSTSPTAPVTVSPPRIQKGSQEEQEQIIQAKRALDAGVPKDKVIEMLIQNGIDPEELKQWQ